MEFTKSPATRYSSLKLAAERTGALALLGLSLLLGGCGNSNNSEHAQTVGPKQNTEAPFTPTQAAGAILTFNSLCVKPDSGCSNVILAYPGVSDDPNKPQDRIYDATYYSGEHVTAVCETKGRTVTSQPSQGESYRQSNEWYKIQDTSAGQPEYVSAVYADVNQSLPACPAS